MNPIILLIVLILGAYILGMALRAYQVYEEEKLKSLDLQIVAYERGWLLLEKPDQFNTLMQEKGFVFGTEATKNKRNVCFKKGKAFDIYVFEDGFVLDFQESKFPVMQMFNRRDFMRDFSKERISSSKIPKWVSLKKNVYANRSDHQRVIDFIRRSSEVQRVMRQPEFEAIFAAGPLFCVYLSQAKEANFITVSSVAEEMLEKFLKEFEDVNNIHQLKDEID